MKIIVFNFNKNTNLIDAWKISAEENKEHRISSNFSSAHNGLFQCPMKFRCPLSK